MAQQPVDKASMEAAGMIAERCGQAAYAEFVQSLLLSHSMGADLTPRWENLTAADRMTWQNVAMAVVRLYSRILPELARPKIVKGH